jgi:hypothetical protein
MSSLQQHNHLTAQEQVEAAGEYLGAITGAISNGFV